MTAPAEPITVAVAIRAGQFLVRDASGQQSVHSGQRLAAALSALPLYGGDLRLWLRWPSDEAERERLDANLDMLAEATGATVWAPPSGGTTVVLDDRAALGALDHTGRAQEWRPYRPPGAIEASPYPPGTDRRGPALAYVERIARPHGVRWLPDMLTVNAEPLVLHVPSAWPPEQVAREGVPAAELFVLGEVHAARVPLRGVERHVLRLRVDPGGAVAMPSVLTHAPPEVRRRMTSADTYLLPAGWLDRARLEGAFRLAGTSLVLRSTYASHGADGIPEDIPRWPAAGVTAEVFAVLPHASAQPPVDLLALHPRLPAAPRSGRRAVRLRLDGGVDGGPGIDVTTGANLLAPLASVRARLTELRADGVELALPHDAFGRVTAAGLYDFEAGEWRERACPDGLPVAALLAHTGADQPAA